MSRNFGVHARRSDPPLMIPGDARRLALCVALTLLVAGPALLAVIGG